MKEVKKMNLKQLNRMRYDRGFIAALDQSGGSTPNALKAYGISETSYSNDEEMFELIHTMRKRIIESPAFNEEYILGAILFENTMDKEINGKKSADYLWEEKGIVPFLKIDKGLAEKSNGVQLMKDNNTLDELLEKAVKMNIFGTKERSYITEANEEGINEIVKQQFEVAKKVSSYGLVPIIEPEVSISIKDKELAETLLLAAIKKELAKLNPNELVMFKLTIPSKDNFYEELMSYPNVVRVVALSGGYSQEEANFKLSKNKGLIASFSRALVEGINVNQTDEEFNNTLNDSIKKIYNASIT